MRECVACGKMYIGDDGDYCEQCVPRVREWLLAEKAVWLLAESEEVAVQEQKRLRDEKYEANNKLSNIRGEMIGALVDMADRIDQMNGVYMVLQYISDNYHDIAVQMIQDNEESVQDVVGNRCDYCEKCDDCEIACAAREAHDALCAVM
jgi:hypothetical protein